MPIINTNYRGVPSLSNPAQSSEVSEGKEYIDENGTKQIGTSKYEKLTRARGLVPTPSGSIDLFPEEFNGISVLPSNAFSHSLPLRRVILPGTVSFIGSTTQSWAYFSYCTNMIFYAGGFPRENLGGSNGLKGVVLPVDTSFNGIAQAAVPSALIKNAVFCTNILCPLNAIASFPPVPLYVKDSLLESYKTATNWSDTKFEELIHGFAESPLYNSATTYSCGDVCQYENKMYIYYHYDDTTNTPTGTSENNEYWYYCGDIEVI